MSATRDENPNDKSPDIIIEGGACDTINLRADRQGNGDGRVYRVLLRARDSSGNDTKSSYEVTVPKSQSGVAAVYSGAAGTVAASSP